MTSYVLVPGAFLGGWCWKRVADRLRAAGHDAYPVTLTGVGERLHLMGPDVGFETHIRDVAALIDYEGLEDVVLCGHSYAGLVITAVADARPNKVSALVYLDAIIGENGKSMWDLIPEDYHAILDPEGSDVSPAITAEAFGVNESDRTWVDEKSTGHPVRSFKEPLNLSAEAAKGVATRVYIRAPAFPHATLERDFAACQTDPDWQTYALDGGHHLMVDDPNGVAEILLSTS